ncbi:MAG: hypothetical protein LBU21_08990, partial [Treponema sp.]|nr:hypothetical protein [Treponema sp.]
SNSKFNCSETEKRPDKYIGGPVGWKKAGPLPLLFSTATPSALFGSLFGLTTQWNCCKKGERKVKKWSNACIWKEDPRLTAFDHFFEFGITVPPISQRPQ